MITTISRISRQVRTLTLLSLSTALLLGCNFLMSDDDDDTQAATSSASVSSGANSSGGTSSGGTSSGGTSSNSNPISNSVVGDWDFVDATGLSFSFNANGTFRMGDTECPFVGSYTSTATRITMTLNPDASPCFEEGENLTEVLDYRLVVRDGAQYLELKQSTEDWADAMVLIRAGSTPVAPAPRVGTLGEWVIDSLTTSARSVTIRYSVVRGSSLQIVLDDRDRSSSTLTGKVDATITVRRPDGTTYSNLSARDVVTTPIAFTALDSVVLVVVAPLSSTGSGKFGVQITENTALSSSVVISVSSSGPISSSSYTFDPATEGELGVWMIDTLTTTVRKLTYRYDVTEGQTFYATFDDRDRNGGLSGKADGRITLRRPNGSVYTSWSLRDNATSPVSVTMLDDELYIELTPYSTASANGVLAVHLGMTTTLPATPGQSSSSAALQPGALDAWVLDTLTSTTRLLAFTYTVSEGDTVWITFDDSDRSVLSRADGRITLRRPDGAAYTGWVGMDYTGSPLAVQMLDDILIVELGPYSSASTGSLAVWVGTTSTTPPTPTE